MTARELEAALIQAYGPDFRDKAIVGPLGSFRLADAFDECGLTDPQAPPDTGPSQGLWQFTPHEPRPAHPPWDTFPWPG